MLLRHPHHVAGLLRDGRRRLAWSQTDLARRIGVSRQWVSAVENGKTSVEFDLVIAALQTLDYGVYVSGEPPVGGDSPSQAREATPAHASGGRTPLTRDGEPLGVRRTAREHG